MRRLDTDRCEDMFLSLTPSLRQGDSQAVRAAVQVLALKAGINGYKSSEMEVRVSPASGEGLGWRAVEKGKHIIRIILDKPRPFRRIKLEFSETEIERTHEFTLRWSAEPGGPFRDIVRQQWTFSPQGSTSEVEDYQVDLDSVSVLELSLKPELTPGNAFATLAKWRVI